jgi:hypothetical protein
MTAPIQYSGPTVSPDVDWKIRQHFQLIYQKLGNHTQAFSLQSQAISKLAKSTTTITESGGGSSSVPISLGGVNDQTGVTAYTTTQGDDGVLLVLNDASPVAVTLDSAVAPPYYLTISNFGAGLATLTPTAGTINGVGTFQIATNGLSILVWDGNNWHATAISAIPTGINATITTAALTVGGTQGSMHFTNGVLVSQTQST